MGVQVEFRGLVMIVMMGCLRFEIRFDNLDVGRLYVWLERFHRHKLDLGCRFMVQAFQLLASGCDMLAL